MAKYTDLDPNLKEELLGNAIALQIACTALSKLTKHPVEHWVTEIGKQANDSIDAMSPKAVNNAVAKMQEVHDQVNAADKKGFN